MFLGAAPPFFAAWFFFLCFSKKTEKMDGPFAEELLWLHKIQELEA
jgi:hypothetical protein